MINGCWKACYEPDDMSGESFTADAIISNPPAFAHVHCAEALGIPITLSFSKTRSPNSGSHPLNNYYAIPQRCHGNIQLSTHWDGHDR
jgi:hypothetical protein